jgi:hypothetical protein
VFLLVLSLLVVGVSATAPAQPVRVGDASQKGSLLVFPKVQVEIADNGTVWFDTIITIGNDHSLDVNLECFWVDAEQKTADFMFTLTGYQPTWFKASDGLGSHGWGVSPFGPGNKEGELKCWAMAVNEATMEEYQALFNHLYGTAILVDLRNAASLEYSAYAFKGHYPDSSGVYKTRLGSTGTLVLDNNYPSPSYDTGSAYITFNFVTTPPPGSNAPTASKTELTLVPLRQDLRQDRLPTCTKAKFDVWNENEVKLTGAYQCIKCWFEGSLERIGIDKDPVSGRPTGYLGVNFSYRSLHTYMGRARVTSVASTQCRNIFLANDPLDAAKKRDLCVDDIYNPGMNLQSRSPFIGLVSTSIQVDEGAIFFGTTPVGAGAFVPSPFDPNKPDETVTIKYDPPGQTAASKRR